MTTVLLLPTTLDHDMTTTKDTRDLIALLIDPHIDHLIYVTLVTDIDHAQIQDIITILPNKHLLLDHRRDPEILGFLNLVHTRLQETN